MTDDAPTPPASSPDQPAEAEARSFNPETFDGVVMSFDRALCGVHGEAFRPAWPKGFGVFMVCIFQELTAIPAVWEEAKKLSGQDKPDVKVLERVMDVKPACCRVSKETLIRVLEHCGVGDPGRCAICRRRALGTPIRAANASWPHVCFTCIAHATPYPPGAV